MQSRFSIFSTLAFKILSAAFFPLISYAQVSESTPAGSDQVAKSFDTSIAYIYDFATVLSGGLKSGSVGFGALNASATADLEKLSLSKGLIFYGQVLATHGQDLTPYAGDAQTASNIEAPSDTVRLYQAWLQQEFFEGQTSVLFGLYDLNSEFNVTDSSALFINSSFGIGKEFSQTGQNGPSVFPVTGIGVRILSRLSERFVLQGAIFEAIPGDPNQPNGTVINAQSDEGTLQVAELNYFPAEKSGTKAGIGLWRYSEQFPDLSETQSNGSPSSASNNGFYLIFENALTETTRGFIRYGRASKEVNEFASNLAVGVTSSAEFLNRPDDEIGLAFTTAQGSDAFLKSVRTTQPQAKDLETAYQLTYRYQLNENFALQPDFQYIEDPSLGTEAKDVSIFILRINAEI